MNSLLTLISLGKEAEASRFQKILNKLIEDGEVWELNSLLFSVKREIEKYRD
jgi:putative GTP pyrophosphokinase